MSKGSEIELTYEEMREMHDALESLINHSGWQFFQRFMESRAEGLKNALMNMEVTDQTSVAKFNYLQGQINEDSAVFVIVEQINSDLKIALLRIQDDMETQEEESDDVRSV